MKTSFYTFDQAGEWDGIVRSMESYCFFHSMAWGKVLADTYGFSPVYLVAENGSEIAAVPLMEVRKPLRGPKGVCLPFSDICGPVFTGTPALEMLETSLCDLIRRRHWKAIEIKDSCTLDGFSPYQSYYEHALALGADLDSIARSFRSSTWRNIKRAEREGVEVQLLATRSALDDYYQLHCITRKRHGVPPQPKRFFDNLYAHVISAGNGFIARATHRGRAVAASVFLHFGTRAVYKFGASLPDPEHLRPSNLIMWEVIKWYGMHGFETLSLGRTDKDDAGLLQFKSGWGTTRREVSYCRWPPRTASRSEPRAVRGHLLHSFARRLPLPVLKLAGTVLYKYLA
jgi:hypothetical protein